MQSSGTSPARFRRRRSSRRTSPPTSPAPTSPSSPAPRPPLPGARPPVRGQGAGALADDRLTRLREAVEVFGFHLCGLDMRQNAAVHEEVVGELLAWAGVCDDYSALDEAG